MIQNVVVHLDTRGRKELRRERRLERSNHPHVIKRVALKSAIHEKVPLAVVTKGGPRRRGIGEPGDKDESNQTEPNSPRRSRLSLEAHSTPVREKQEYE
jgi:hypothetical protein